MLNSPCEKHSLTHWKLKLCLGSRKCFSSNYPPYRTCVSDSYTGTLKEAEKINKINLISDLNKEGLLLMNKINRLINDYKKKLNHPGVKITEGSIYSIKIQIDYPAFMDFEKSQNS